MEGGGGRGCVWGVASGWFEGGVTAVVALTISPPPKSSLEPSETINVSIPAVPSCRSFLLLIIPDRLSPLGYLQCIASAGRHPAPSPRDKVSGPIRLVGHTGVAFGRGETINENCFERWLATRRLTLFTHRVVSGWALTRRGIHTRGGDCTR